MMRSSYRPSLAAIGVIALVVTSSACSSATETGLEKLIESQGGGNVDLDLGGDGFSIRTEDGQMTVDADGNFVVTDSDGNVVTGSADSETGAVNVESDDGSFRIGATTELPDEWPGNVPAPNGLAIASATVIGSGTDQAISVAGTVESDAFMESYGSALQSAGFTEDSSFKAEGTINNTYSNSEWMVSTGFYGGGIDNQVTISLFRNS